MNGDRMTPQQARALVGCKFAGHVNTVHYGMPRGSVGDWIAGEVIAYTDRPVLIIEQADGTRDTYIVDGISDWSSSAVTVPRSSKEDT